MKLLKSITKIAFIIALLAVSGCCTTDGDDGAWMIVFSNGLDPALVITMATAALALVSRLTNAWKATA